MILKSAVYIKVLYQHTNKKNCSELLQRTPCWNIGKNKTGCEQVEARAKQEKLYKSGCEPVENSYEPNLKAVEKRSKIVLNPRQSRENVETLKKHPCKSLRKTIYSALARAN